MLCECGYTLQGSARFCSQCGKEVLVTENTQTVPCPNTVQKCKRTPICGALIQSSSKFCSGCGWFINLKTFLPGAAMCDGTKRNGELCDNIVTPNIKFCSECGRPPIYSQPSQETSALADFEKTALTKPEKDLIGGAINQDVQENETSDDHVIEDMDFEVVSVSSTEGETPVKRSHSYDEAVNLETSSDFYNGQLANIARELDSSTSIQDSKLQQHFMDIVDLPTGGSVEHVQLDGLVEEGENGNITNEKTDDLEKLQDNRMDTTYDNAGIGSVECTPKMDISQGGKISISNESGSVLSESSNTGTLSAVNVEKPQATPSQNEGADDEVDEDEDSGTLSTENTVNKPTCSQDGGHEQQVIDGIKTLDVRKRKSPDKDIPEVGKKPHLSENQSDGDDNGNKQDLKEEGTEDEDQVTDEDDEEDEDDENAADDDDNGDGKKIDSGNNDGDNENTKQKKTKKKSTVKKKGRMKYKKKKGQLVDKPTDCKKEETKDGSLNKKGRKKDELPKSSSVEPKAPDKQEKTKDNEKVKSQTPKSNEKKTTEKSNKKSSNELKSNESTDPTSSGSNSNENKSEASTSNGNEKPTYAAAAAAGSDRHSMTTRGSQLIEVTFHVIVSYSCAPNPNSNLVYLRFVNRELGGWNELRYQMHPKMMLSNIGTLYEGTVEIPKKIVNRDFYYLYSIVPFGRFENQVLEYYFFHEKKDRHRLLKVPDKVDTWHRYDGLVLPEPGKEYYSYLGLMFESKKYEDDVTAMLRFAVVHFFPQWEGVSIDQKKTVLPVMEAIEAVNMLFLGLWHNYGNVMRKWNNQTDKFRSDIGKTVFNLLQPHIIEGKLSHIAAIGMLYVLEKFAVDLNDPEYSILFRSLIFDGAHEEEAMEQFQLINKTFTEDFLKTLLEKLIEKYQYSNNPMWLCCLPLWHFVTRKVAPFERAQLSAKHDQTKPVWWGIDGISRAVECVKKTKWTNIKEMTSLLLPMVPMDYLLLRSFMSALRYEQFSCVFDLVALPPEITIAATIFYVKTSSEVENKKEVTKRCFENIVQQIDRKHKENEQM